MVGQHNKMSTFLVVFAALLAAVSAAITQDHLRGAIHACYPKITTGPRMYLIISQVFHFFPHRDRD
ncbi:hypothetical protein J6590_089182 [Homalodisca vitripennis]|nr:hypothetical protein J6590_089182 [Homalodisca vitripennis]